MSIRILTLSAAALALSALVAPASADQAGSVYGAKTVGALHNESRGVATDAAAVARQGGFATAATVRWTAAPAAEAGSVYGAKAVGALYHETRGLATDAAAVARQGGFATAATVRWTEAPAVEAALQPGAVYGVGTVGAMLRETAGVAVSEADVARQGGGVTANAVRWTAIPSGS